MANYQDYQNSSYRPEKDDMYRPRSSGVGILIAIGILAAIILGLTMLGRTDTTGIKQTPSAPEALAPTQPSTNGIVNEE